MGYSPWGRKELDTTEETQQQQQQQQQSLLAPDWPLLSSNLPGRPYLGPMLQSFLLLKHFFPQNLLG